MNKKTLPHFVGVGIVALFLGMVLQFQLGVLSVRVCFEDDSCKVFTSGADMRTWYGV